MKLKLATTTYDFTYFGGYRMSQEESVRLIHEAGFRYLDYGFSYANAEGVFEDGWEKLISGVKNTADELSMKFVQAHAPMGASTSTSIDEGNEQFIADNIRCIECCAKLGIDRIVVHAGYKGGITKDENFELNKEFYKKLLPKAEECGVYILTENFLQMHHESGVYWMDTAKDIKEFLQYVDHPMLKVCWDIGHANTLKIPQDESLKILGDDVYAVHVQDNAGVEHPMYSFNDTHIAPLFGTTSFDSVIHGLEEIGYKGAFTMETAVINACYKFKNQYEKDNRLNNPLPLDIKMDCEKLLYKIGRYMLESYDCFEG